jgi:hypothetical protein
VAGYGLLVSSIGTRRELGAALRVPAGRGEQR